MKSLIKSSILFKSAALLAMSLFSIAGAHAQEAKIGFVNTERVFREAAPAMKAQKKLEKEFTSWMEKLKKNAFIEIKK